jgi:hypothetical protein
MLLRIGLPFHQAESVYYFEVILSNVYARAIPQVGRHGRHPELSPAGETATFPELTRMLVETREAKRKAVFESASWQRLARVERALWQ